MSRRQLLAGLGVAGSLSVAGCVGNDDSADESDETDDADETDIDEGPRIELNGITLASAFPIRLVDIETETVVGDLHYHDETFSHWHGMPVTIPANESTTLDILLTDVVGERVSVAETDIAVEIRVAEDSPRGVVDIDIDGDRVTFTADSPGTTELILELSNDGELQYETPEIPVAVE